MKSSFKKVLGSLSALVLTVSTTVPAFAEGPSISGFVDFGYSYNFNSGMTNELRAFDGNANTLTLQNAEIVVSGKAKDDVSYRVDVGYGWDSAVVNSFDGFDGSAAGAQVGLQQAFLTKTCPVTHGTFTFGKFVTPFGAEVIEAKDDYNISRGILFNSAIPLVHTGIKYDKSFGDLGLMAGIVNGWDVMQDVNKSKTFIAQAAKPFGDKIKIVLGGAYGPEQSTPDALGNSTEGNGRALVDAIVSVMPTDKFTLIANLDWGVEEGLAPVDADNLNQNWTGLGIHANLVLTDSWSVAGRYETMSDEGSRFLEDVNGDTFNNDKVTLNTMTFTLQHKMNDVIARVEYRMDSANEDIFLDDKGAADGSQNTIGLQWIYAFQ